MKIEYSVENRLNMFECSVHTPIPHTPISILSFSDSCIHAYKLCTIHWEIQHNIFWTTCWPRCLLVKITHLTTRALHIADEVLFSLQAKVVFFLQCQSEFRELQDINNAATSVTMVTTTVDAEGETDVQVWSVCVCVCVCLCVHVCVLIDCPHYPPAITLSCV